MHQRREYHIAQCKAHSAPSLARCFFKLPTVAPLPLNSGHREWKWHWQKDTLTARSAQWGGGGSHRAHYHQSLEESVSEENLGHHVEVVQLCFALLMRAALVTSSKTVVTSCHF